MCITYVSISARLRHYGIELTAVGPDDQEKQVFIDGCDIREFYGINPAQWLERHERNESALWELFDLVNGIAFVNI
jgi:hypothetical protein